MSEIAKRKKNHVNTWNKKQKHYSLNIGLKGFLCSCNNREKECIKESYNILNKYADQIFGSVQPQARRNESDALEDEIEELKSENNTAERKRFQIVSSGAKNVLFIRTTVEDPVKLAATIVSDIYTSKQQQTKFLIRLVPIEITCKAYVEDIKQAAVPLLNKYFTDSSKLFSIIYNHRNNNSLSKDDVIKTIAEVISDSRSDHVVSLKNPDICVIIEVIRNIAMLSVIPNYVKHRKYNLHLICDSGENDLETTSIIDPIL